ncbi:MAG: NAD(P)/FAD-dependent oxidoreductase, partial [Planctomycetales bacterium]|nr:NAD(P)/FAD-dependent oxidoreductase [Planctomycetales bacterium]
VSTASYVVSLLDPEIMRDLKLKEHGLRILPRVPSSFTPTRDGRHLMLGADPALNHEQIRKFSVRDAEAYPQFQSLLEKVAAQLEPLLSKSAPDLLPMPANWRRRTVGQRLKSATAAWRIRQALAQLGNSLPEALELISGAARPILERWFESDVLRATLATDAIIGSFSSVSAPGTAYVLLHHVMGTAGGARGVWGYVEGGMGAIAESIWKVCQQLGVTLVRECEVCSIDVAGGRVQSVTDRAGKSYTTRCVASGVDANLTFNRFLDQGTLPDEFRAAVNRIDYSSATAKINLALNQLPEFRGLPAHQAGPQHMGTIHICDSMDWLERAYDDAKYGRPSDRPILEITIPSAVDHTLAPTGKHLMNMFVQYTPYRLSGGKKWDDIKEGFADRCIDLLVEFAPNMRSAIEHRQVLSPVDLERVYGLTGGNIFQGAMSLNQLFSLRPIPGWADHRTPVQGLYLCGAASHPGGGVMGICGRNAAHAILADR